MYQLVIVRLKKMESKVSDGRVQRKNDLEPELGFPKVPTKQPCFSKQLFPLKE